MKYYIWSIMLCGPESWTLCKADQKCSESFELCCGEGLRNHMDQSCEKYEKYYIESKKKETS